MDANHQVVAGKKLRQRKAYCPRCSREMGVLDLMCYECGFSFPAEQIALSAFPAVRKRKPWTWPTAMQMWPWVVAAEVMVVWTFALWGAGFFGRRGPFGGLPIVSDEPFLRAPAFSRNIESDKKIMWQARFDAPCGNSFHPPVSAVNAANRVFTSIDLTGLTGDQVSEVLNEPPLRFRRRHPGVEHSRVYTFETGHADQWRGWSFTLRFDANGKVSEVWRAALE